MLHGDVKINDHQIISYRVVNTQEMIDDRTIYHVWVSGRDARGYPFEYQYDYLHYPKDGAAVLAANVLLEINRRVNT